MIKFLHYGEQSDVIPLVAVPGIDGSVGSIKPLVDGISPRREVIVVDYTEENNATMQGLAEEIAEKIRTDIQRPFHLSGQSIGTIVASKIDNLDLPVQKVILTGTFTKLSPFPLRLSVISMKLSPDWLYRLTTRPVLSYVCGPVRDGADHPFFETSKKSDKSDISRRTEWLIGPDFSSDLEKITSPLLILMGEKDRYVPDAAEEIKKLRTLFRDKENCRIEVIRDAGHVFLPSEAIETAIQNINRFLK